MKHLLLLLLMSAPFFLKAQTWTELLTDAANDGANPSLLDGTKLEFRQNKTTDSLWFRITTPNLDNTKATQVGVNVMVNIPEAAPTFKFWGAQNKAPYHKLLTAWVIGSAPSNYTGTIGIGNAGGIAGSKYNNVHKDNLTIRVNVAEKNIVIGVKREHLITNAEFKGKKNLSVGIAAAVGAHNGWNDDLYQAGTTMDVEMSGSVGVPQNEFAKVSLFPNPAGQYLSVKGLSKANTPYEIVSATGQVVQKGMLENNGEVSVVALEPGLYLMRMEGLSTRRFIKR